MLLRIKVRSYSVVFFYPRLRHVLNPVISCLDCFLSCMYAFFLSAILSVVSKVEMISYSWKGQNVWRLVIENFWLLSQIGLNVLRVLCASLPPLMAGPYKRQQPGTSPCIYHSSADSGQRGSIRAEVARLAAEATSGLLSVLWCVPSV